jgi:hypothetical protein
MTRAQRRRELQQLVANLQADEHSTASLAMILDGLELNGWTITTDDQADQLPDPANRRLTLTRLDRLGALGLNPLIERAQRDGWVLLAAVDGVAIVVQGRGRGRAAQIDPAVAARIHREHHNGRAPAQIARDLDADGIPTVNGGPWRDATVRTVLTRPCPPPRTAQSCDARTLARQLRSGI